MILKRDRSKSTNEEENNNQIYSSEFLQSSSASTRERSCSSSLSLEQRRQKILKYWEKKIDRQRKKSVRYVCRKDLADNRFRYHGRFISKEQMEMLKVKEEDEIYDPA